ncbi:f7be0216-a7e3-425c-8c5c-1f50b638a214 [Sclerotinia trifoliorum]|uniref:F7be0216-a7e3-425c-8c5c-1f50b638a214 n=1 Tax=Sclerotinia trifoliorum TaxID=28548 RepID=A0A8H2W351_9HELO|nr:f7be0216-a7e3-425c-8c5c-1f50b638a214 [Sclerotinia trifoliorum]
MDSSNTPQMRSDKVKLNTPSQIPLPVTPVSTLKLREATRVPLPESPIPIASMHKLKISDHVSLPETPLRSSVVKNLVLNDANIPLPETPTPEISPLKLEDASRVPLPETLQSSAVPDKLKQAIQTPLPSTPPQSKSQTQSTKFTDQVMSASKSTLKRTLDKFSESNIVQLREIVEYGFLYPLVHSGKVSTLQTIGFDEIDHSLKWMAFNEYIHKKASMDELQGFVIELGNSDEVLRREIHEYLGVCAFIAKYTED